MKKDIRTGLLVDVLNAVEELLKSLLSNWEATSSTFFQAFVIREYNHGPDFKLQKYIRCRIAN